jgi:hypothetical protein
MKILSSSFSLASTTGEDPRRLEEAEEVLDVSSATTGALIARRIMAHRSIFIFFYYGKRC